MWMDQMIWILLCLTLVVWCLVVVVRAVRGPKRLAGGAVCGGCGYAVTHPVPEKCSECGVDLLEVGVVTIRQASRRPRMIAALAAWTLVASLVGLAAGSYVAATMRATRARAARQAAILNRTTTTSQVLGYRLGADPRVTGSDRTLGITVDTSVTTGSQGNVAAGSHASFTFEDDLGPPAKIVLDLQSGQVSYEPSKGPPSKADVVDPKDVAALLSSMSLAWKPGEVELHAGALGSALENLKASGGANFRLERSYLGAGLRQPMLRSTRSAMSSSSGVAGGTQPLIGMSEVAQFGIPAGLLLSGWVAIPLRMRSVRRRELEHAAGARAADAAAND